MYMNRRQYLGGIVSVGAVAVAGCSSGSGGDGGSDDSEGIESYQRVDGYVLSKSFPMEVYDPQSGDRLAEVHWHEDWKHWHQSPLEVPLDEWSAYELRVNNPDLEAIPIGEDRSLQLDVNRTEETPETLVAVQPTGTFIEMNGQTEGTGELVFRLVSDGEAVWTSPALPIEVS